MRFLSKLSSEGHFKPNTANPATRWSVREMVASLEKLRLSGILENCLWTMFSSPGMLRCFLNDGGQLWFLEMEWIIWPKVYEKKILSTSKKCPVGIADCEYKSKTALEMHPLVMWRMQLFPIEEENFFQYIQKKLSLLSSEQIAPWKTSPEPLHRT